MPPAMCAGGCGREARADSRFCAVCRPPADLPPFQEFVQRGRAAQRAVDDVVRNALPDSFSNHPPHAPGSSTSRRAAEHVGPRHRSQMECVYDYVLGRGRFHADTASGGATRAEIAAALNMRLASVCSAVNTLYRQGRIGSNPGDERVDPDTGQRVEVLVHESFVDRWRGTWRRGRTMLSGKPCDLVDPATDVPVRK
jgi:hypothetical protein